LAFPVFVIPIILTCFISLFIFHHFHSVEGRDEMLTANVHELQRDCQVHSGLKLFLFVCVQKGRDI
jgi:hypothetical protein